MARCHAEGWCVLTLTSWLQPPDPFFGNRFLAGRVYRMCRWDNCPV